MLRLQLGAHTVKFLVAAALVTAMIVACGSPKASVGAPPMAPQSAVVSDTPEHHQIQELSDQIDQQRGSLRIPEQHAAPMTSMTAGVEPQVCKRDPSATCVQTCQLSDSICDNAKKICDLAQTLREDDWAAKKCGDANATCGTAAKTCCECSAN
ncbi:MAG TPA: hypothetical protein VGC41_06750 [Kofleriaceae bacterium]